VCVITGERKRKKKDAGHVPRKHFPLSERQQLALLMQMTAEENNGMLYVQIL